MDVRENDGYDMNMNYMILHKISQYDTMRSQNAPSYLTTVCSYLLLYTQVGLWSTV